MYKAMMVIALLVTALMPVDSDAIFGFGKDKHKQTQQEISEVSRQVDAVETLVWVIVVLVVAIVLFLLYCRFFGDREDDSPSLAPTLTDEERSVLEQHQKDKEAKARQQAQQ